MDPGIPVPPKLYGGHERLVYLFAQEYKRLGHEVHLLVSEGSCVPNCTIHSLGKDNLSPGTYNNLKTLFKAWRFLFRKRRDFDLIHNFGRLAYLLPILNEPVFKIMTYGREIHPRNISWVNQLPKKNLKFTAPSNDCVESGGAIGEWKRVYNAIDFSQYDPVYELPDSAPLIFLSRLERVKGCHIAIQVAKMTNNNLIIAGNVSSQPDEIEHFKKEIEPHIDGIQIKYVGAVNDIQKNHYLGMAKAMLFPIDIREAFGMVMAESMACGTPVIGFNKGAVPEVIIDTVNGFVVSNPEEMINAVSRLSEINRMKCRENAESRFDVKVITKEYLSLVNS
jgi:glycosyltransferase involved in cell wall biosynthesis